MTRILTLFGEFVGGERGHKDTRMLMRYTHLRAEDLVGRLGWFVNSPQARDAQGIYWSEVFPLVSKTNSPIPNRSNKGTNE